MSEDKYDYSEPIQKKIVAMLLYNKAMFSENIELINSQYFDSLILQDLVKIIKKFYTEHKRPPTEDEFIEEFKSFMGLGKNKNLPEDEYTDVVNEIMRIGREGDFAYEQKKVISFARYQSAKNALIRGAKKRIPKLDIEKMKLENNEDQAAERIRIADEKLEIARKKTK